MPGVRTPNERSAVAVAGPLVLLRSGGRPNQRSGAGDILGGVPKWFGLVQRFAHGCLIRGWGVKPDCWRWRHAAMNRHPLSRLAQRLPGSAAQRKGRRFSCYPALKCYPVHCVVAQSASSLKEEVRSARHRGKQEPLPARAGGDTAEHAWFSRAGNRRRWRGRDSRRSASTPTAYAGFRWRLRRLQVRRQSTPEFARTLAVQPRAFACWRLAAFACLAATIAKHRSSTPPAP